MLREIRYNEKKQPILQSLNFVYFVTKKMYWAIFVILK